MKAAVRVAIFAALTAAAFGGGVLTAACEGKGRNVAQPSAHCAPAVPALFTSSLPSSRGETCDQ